MSLKGEMLTEKVQTQKRNRSSSLTKTGKPSTKTTQRRKPVRGVEEEEHAYFISIITVSVGWFILPFLAGGYTLYLTRRAEKEALRGRKRSLRKLRKARRNAIISFFLSSTLIVAVIAMPSLVSFFVSRNVQKVAEQSLPIVQGVTGATLNNPSGDPNQTGGENSTGTPVDGNVATQDAVALVGSFLSNSAGEVIKNTGEGMSGALVKKAEDGTEIQLPYGRLLPEGSNISVTGIGNDFGTLNSFCFSVENSTNQGQWFVWTNSTTSPEVTTSPC